MYGAGGPFTDMHLITVLIVLLCVYGGITAALAAIITNVAKIFPRIRPYGKQVFYVAWAVIALSGFAALFVYCYTDTSFPGK